MLRLLMATTALSALLVTGALSQDASSSSSAMDSSMMSSQASDASGTDSSMMSSQSTTASAQPAAPVDIASGYTRVDTDRLASKLIGQPVYDGTGADANNLGNITDLVLNENGQVAAVVLGVGGFLGLGQKQVAVDFSALQFTVAADNTERYVVQATKDQLTSAPDFQTVDDQPSQANQAGSDATGASSNDSGATATSSNDMTGTSSSAAQ